jgi:hypothetical protein
MHPRRLRFAVFASQPSAADTSVAGDNQRQSIWEIRNIRPTDFGALRSRPDEI